MKYTLPSSAATKKTSSTERDLHLAFDVGHSSIGWAVLQTRIDKSPELLGCGTVIFQADDCLASQRRQFRRQRRHIRATRLRIARIRTLLASLAVLSAEELGKVSSSSPWFLAARVLRGGKLLSWPELWDVLRWYAHNRGYDGNKAWSRHEQDAAAAKEDAEKVQNARTLYDKYGTHTMCETWCAVSGLDPLGAKTSCHLPGDKRPKSLNAAFPREDIEREVRAILEKHIGHLPKVDASLIAALMSDWKAIPCSDVRLPARYRGGLLFGQLKPRFENRIIARCPITYQRVLEKVLAEENDEEKAKLEAEKQAKVPNADCPEFFRYRWVMQLANVQVATDDPKQPRRLSVKERRELDRQITERGYFTKGEFIKAVETLTNKAASNVKQMVLHPDADKALVVDPVQRVLTGDEFAPLFATLPERLQKRVRGQLRRGTRLTLGGIRNDLEEIGEVKAFDGEISRQLDIAGTKRSKKAEQLTREKLLTQSFQIEPISGRAPHSRAVMCEVVDFVLSTDRHPAEGTEGATNNGPLFRGSAIRTAQLQRAIDEQTNNHLVRHRLRILERLHADILKTYAADEKSCVGKITIEVNRELKELSGKTAKQIAQDLGQRLSNFKSVSEKLEKELEGKNIPIGPGLIRKARIAEDLGWKCPYTGKSYDVFDLVYRRVDKDHIVPRSQRASDSLDSLVITFAEVNKMKGKRTAYRFVEECQSKTVEGAPHLTIKPLAVYLKDVEALETFKGHDDDKRRKKNRKRLLLLRDYVEKEFVPADLTQTSQLVRLGAQALERHYTDLEEKPVITSLPGSITGAVRKSWDLLGCLAAANNNVIDPATGAVRTKTEIRDITHLHHALDASTLALASFFLPRDGGAWELLIKRKLNDEEQKRARNLFKDNIEIEQSGSLRLTDLPTHLKDQIRTCLAKRHVVQHIPKELNGLPAQLNAWRVQRIEGTRVWLRQRTRQPDGSRKESKKDVDLGKVVGVQPENGNNKLKAVKGALILDANYGIAILDHTEAPLPSSSGKKAKSPGVTIEIVPYLKVWHRLAKLKEINKGHAPRILRSGQSIRVPKGTHAGFWRIFSVKNNAGGKAVALGEVDALHCRDDKQNVLVSSLLRDGMEIIPSTFCGVDAPRVLPTLSENLSGEMPEEAQSRQS